MKKLWIILLAVLTSFVIVSCNNDETTEIEYNLNEQLDVPNNLSVDEDSKILTWSPVDNALRYNVYIDGELEAEVTNTSFDFSALSASRLLFTIKAMAPTGIQNSEVSTTIAYVANRESEVSKMKLSIQSSGMNIKDEDAFASELVNKGMLSDDFESMMDVIDDIQILIDAVEKDLSNIYNEINLFIDTVDMTMVEAFVSSLIKVELRAMIASELENYQPSSGVIQSEESMEELQDLLDFIDDEGDQAVKSAMIVIEYLVEVETNMDSELISNMETIVDSEDISNANVDVLVKVKNDLITNFKDNLPELQDIIVLNSTLLAFINVLTEDTIDTSMVSVPKQSAQALLSMELFFNFILELDDSYINTLIELNSNTSLGESKSFMKENIRLIDQYLENNDLLLDQLNNIYTDEEKEMLFYDYYLELVLNSYLSIFSSNPANSDLDDNISNLIETETDFNDILLLRQSMGQSLNMVLDAIIENDYAMIDAIYELAEVSSDTTSTEIEMSDAVSSLVKESLAVINPVIQDINVAEYNAFLDIIFGELLIEYEIEDMTSTNDNTHMVEIIGFIENAFANTASNQLNIIKDMFDLLEQTNYIDDFVSLYQSGHVGGQEDEYYGAMILLAKAYSEFYNDSETDIDAMVDELLIVLNKEEVKSYLDMTTEDIETIETNINDLITDLDTNANKIKDYDYTSLTSSQKLDIDVFVTSFAGIIYLSLIS
ncbi:hypothetical protein KHQ88_00635 [Mycoplasmatota bacterium]|nr:hypothetical protein KHQ88_00635 [Mycoplasmatota bacterium]